MKLFIPGPVDVRREILNEMSRQMINHRGKEFAHLLEGLQKKLQSLFMTKNTVLLAASSATGIMEAAVRNCVKTRCLSLCNGGFSDKWHEIALLNGKEADKIQYDWGKAVKPEDVDEALATGKYDSVTLVHNESSTGVMNPLPQIAKVVKKYSAVVFLVDAVSSLGAVPIPVDELGIDVCLAGVQKALAVPPGLTVFSVSEKALERSKVVQNKGYYFDFLVMMDYFRKLQPITTPPISQIFALDRQLTDILKNGLEHRFEHHEQLAALAMSWARKHFALFAEPGFESKTITVVDAMNKINVSEFLAGLEQNGFELANGYGKLKEKTFRIGHMGDVQLDEVRELLAAMENALR